MLEPSVLAPHAGTTLQRLGDEDDDVRHCAVRVLGKLEPSAPAPHVGAIPQLPSCFSLVVFAVGPRRRRRRLVLVGSCVVFRRRRFSWSWSSSSRFSWVVLAVVFLTRSSVFFSLVALVVVVVVVLAWSRFSSVEVVHAIRTDSSLAYPEYRPADARGAGPMH